MKKNIKPILFNQEMTKAILDERKTVTRRDPFKFKMKDGYNPEWSGYSLGEYYTGHIETGACLYSRGAHDVWGVRSNVVKPRFLPGDILYVRETAMIQCMKAIGRKVKMLFAADDSLVEFSVSEKEYERLLKWGGLQRFLSPYWLTKETTRIWLKVTDVRVERLQDITEEQAWKEGIFSECSKCNCHLSNECNDCANQYESYFAFGELWDSTVKEEWQKFTSNPWVFVYEFERCEKLEMEQIKSERYDLQQQA